MLTVGVVALSQPHFTRMCLERVLDSTLAREGRVNLIVVLNGAGAEVASSVTDLLGNRANTLILSNPSNRGFAAACNQILEQAHTPFVGFVHNDVIVARRTFEILVYWLERLSNRVVGILPLTSYANEQYPCIEELHKAFLEIKPPNKPVMERSQIEEILDGLYGDLDDYAETLAAANVNRPVTRCDETSSFCWIFRTSKLRELGGFSAEFPLRGFEDKELWLRMVQQDLDLALCHTTVVHHHGNLTTDGEGLSFPEVFADHEKIYKRFAERHLKIHKPPELPPQRRLVLLSRELREHVDDLQRKVGKRLLYFGTHYPPENAGGAELSLHETFRHLTAYGVEICAFTFRNRRHQKFEAFKSFYHDETRVFQVPEEGGEDLRQKFDFVVERFQPDVVLGHSGLSYHAFEHLATHYPEVKRLFAFRHQSDITDGRLAAYLANDGGTRIIANSKWMQDLMLEMCGRESTVVLPVVSPSSCVLPEARKSRRVISIGNGVSSKGVRTLLDIAAQLPELEFHIWGSLDPSIPDSLLPANVHYRGWTSQLRDMYAEARVVVNLSPDPEPFGRTLMEALLNGIPVVARAVGGPPEFVSQGGVLVDSFDEVPAVLKRLFEEETFYESLRRGTVTDTAAYNPYHEREKLIATILECVGVTMLPRFAY